MPRKRELYNVSMILIVFIVFLVGSEGAYIDALFC